MALLTVQEISKTGIVPSFVQVLDGDGDTDDTFYNDGKTYVEIVNGTVGTALVVTVSSQVNCNQNYDHDLSITVSAATSKKNRTV